MHKLSYSLKRDYAERNARLGNFQAEVQMSCDRDTLVQAWTAVGSFVTVYEMNPENGKMLSWFTHNPVKV